MQPTKIWFFVSIEPLVIDYLLCCWGVSATLAVVALIQTYSIRAFVVLVFTALNCRSLYLFDPNRISRCSVFLLLFRLCFVWLYFFQLQLFSVAFLTMFFLNFLYVNRLFFYTTQSEIIFPILGFRFAC